MPSGQILLADDDAAIRTVLNQALSRAGYDVRSTGNAATLWRWAAQGDGDLIITDVVMPDENAFDLLPRIKKVRPDLPIIVMSAQNTFMTAIRASERGAYEYLPKPFDLKELIAIVGRALSRPRGSGAGGAAPEGEDIPLVGRSPAMQEIYRALARLMPTDLTVTITGESGTGKELVARALHDYGKRRKGPFVPVNMAAIPRDLIESELFGHEKGAFTGASAGRAGLVEAADGGTLFLDEIGELPLEAQARLLRVLQEGEIRRVGSVQSQKVDVRLIAATHRDLKNLAKAGQFREDLYYRLHVIALKLPALRERGSDVNEIANAFLARQSARIGRDDLHFSAEAEQAIRHYSWPGNVRELENAVERAVILSESAEISADMLGIDIELSDLEEDDILDNALVAASASSASHEPTEDLSLEDYFQHFVLEHQDHMTETELARKLGVSRKCLWERRQRLGIPRRKSNATSDN